MTEVDKYKERMESGRKILNLATAKEYFEVDMIEKDIKPITVAGQSKPIMFDGSLMVYYGLPGTNKTGTAIQEGAKAAKKSGKEIFLFDGELNGGATKRLAQECGVNYIPSDIKEDKLKKLIEDKVDCSNAIIILDSFSRMLPEGMSNNDGTDTTKVMETALDLNVKLGGTVIVIEHGTATSYDEKGQGRPGSAKLQGNAVGKERLSDFLFQFVPNGPHYSDGTKMICMRSREQDILPKYTEIIIEADRGRQYEPSSY